MFFEFLRSIFTDDQYLDLKERLAVTEEKIANLERSLQQKDEKVEIEFIPLLWVMMGAVGAFILFTTQTMLAVLEKIQEYSIFAGYQDVLKNIIGGTYIVVLIFTINYMWNQISFGLDLLRKYGDERKDKKYLDFAKELRWIFIIFIVILVLYASTA